MSSPKRKYFVIFDKDRSQKKELAFNVNFFYLKSTKKRRKISGKESFSYVNAPFFKGIVIFGRDFKNKMRPLKFDKIQKDGPLKPVNPKILKRFLLAEENKFVAFANQAEEVEISPVLEMLSSFHFDDTKIRRLTVCNSCVENKEFKILSEKEKVRSLQGQIICSKCALEIVLKDIAIKGLIDGEKISPKLKNFFNHMILKFHDVKKVLSAFEADFDPIKNRDVTLYDVEKNQPVNKKYLKMNVDDIQIPEKLRNTIKDSKITTLLPIQAMALEGGLLSERVSQLIMAPTSGGKTLIGELAGISRILANKNKKMLYLVPIVALANVRYAEFRKKYKPLKLNVVKRVGESLLEKTKDRNPEGLLRAHVIIATYEAIDYIFRSGNKELMGDIGTIIIDEIQTLIVPDRGFLLDGFIARLKILYNDCQFLYLSATVGEPAELASKLNSKLIRYNNRPVPVERHLILCMNEVKKQRLISRLVKSAFYKKSKYGFKGQSIVFTNTRKKCESLTEYLQKRGVNMRAYHSGLTAAERKQIELQFQAQKISGVVSTAALAAGVDFPASQVIFEALAMGINWLTVAEFEQMLGRAGRLKKHDLGLAYLLIQPGKVYSPKMKLTEENIAIKLLKGKIKDFELEPNENKSLTELLAFIAMFNQGVSRKEIEKFYNTILNNNYSLEALIKRLNEFKLIRTKENLLRRTTRLGKAIAKSFLSVKIGLEIIESLKKRTKSVIEIALGLKSLRNVYISKKIVADLSRNVSMKYFSNNLFSSSVLSLLNAEHVKKKRGHYSRDYIDFIVSLISDIFNCKCKDNPYCDCGRLNLEKMILSLRTEDKFSIKEICEYLEDKYKILVFKGDIIDYLESLIYSLESVKNIAEGVSNLDQDYDYEIAKIPKIVEKIKGY